ncbi:FecCD family ABC transporter permease [Corynebacterium falsenii]|uniref:FecCD family ABC transporter permease n=1 Tax=Corynebacterium falsenii TaxID=108486 RepID=UPI003FD1BD5D
MSLKHAFLRRSAPIFGIFALLASIVCAACLGSVTVPLPEVAAIMWAHFPGHDGELPSSLNEASPVYEQIVWELRVPRTCAAVLVGAILAVAGVVLQALVRNPLADSSIIGASAGASLATVLAAAIGLGGGAGAWITQTPLFAGAGAVVALTAVLLLAAPRGGMTGTRVILTGVAVGQILMAAVSFVQLRLAPADSSAILFWLLGSVAGVDDIHRVGLPALASLAVIAVLWLRARSVDVISLGDDDAIALGIAPHRLKWALVLAVGLLTGIAVGLAGTVSFFGLLVPHAVRIFTGPSHRWLLLTSAVWGGAGLVFIDIASRTLGGGQELPLSIFTALLGGPLFVLLLGRSGYGGAR